MTITLDAAGTLIDVRWNPVAFAIECAHEVGLPIEDDAAASLYDHLLRSRWGHYQELNLTRDPDTCDEWWRALAREWLVRLEQDPAQVEPLTQVVMRRLYTKGSEVFRLYDDTIPALEALRAAGHRLAILSNWDYSLHRVVAMLEIGGYFDLVVASLEEGPEKPDPELFRITLDRLGAKPAEALHVGDNPVDDLRGAQQFGMGAILLDRAAIDPAPPIVRSLLDVPPLAGSSR
jgi:REG-2-like HAD superfamily hydrolase